MAKPCIVAFCLNLGRHKFPKNEEWRKQWIEAIAQIKPELAVRKYSLICSDHFRPTDFSITPSSCLRPDIARRTLKKTAVPSIFPWNTSDIRQKPTSNLGSAEGPLAKPLSLLSAKNNSCEENAKNQVLSAPSTSAIGPARTLKTYAHASQKSGRRRALKRHAVPSIFPWTKLSSTHNREHGSQSRPCSSCLSYGRDLEPLGDLTDIYWTLVPGEENPGEVLVCWECRGALRRCASFQQRAARARDVLTMMHNGNLPKITDNSHSLSTLAKVDVAYTSMGKVDVDDITATNVQTSVPEDRGNQKVSVNVMNVITKSETENQKTVAEAKHCVVQDTGAMYVEIDMSEPMCEMVTVKLEIEDPLETKQGEHEPDNSVEETVKNNAIDLATSSPNSVKNLGKQKRKDDGLICVNTKNIMFVKSYKRRGKVSSE